MKEKIRPCLCGGNAELVGKRHYRVICPKCGVEGGDALLPSEAIKLWNAITPVQCKNCKYYRADLKWCDKLSVYLDKDDMPTIEKTDRWIAFKPTDYCSFGEVEDE